MMIYSTVQGGKEEASGESGKRKRRLTLPSGAGANSFNSQGLTRAYPCCPIASRGPNQGKMTGIPPRIGWFSANRLHLLRNNKGESSRFLK